MGLYLSLFDCEEKEINGVEIGSYEYFGFFRDSINEIVENSSQWGIVCPNIMIHSDCDGRWEPENCKEIISELQKIKIKFQITPSCQKIIDLKKEIINLYGIQPANLYDCFVDVDGENLIERLKELCECAYIKKLDILFQ